MNFKRSRITAVMTLALSILAVLSSFAGIFNKGLYQAVLNTGSISLNLLRGSVAQDIISVPLGLILAILSVLFLIHNGYKTFIAILGITGNFFYAYGLYAIQGQYTSIYLLYLLIFSLAIYSLIIGIASFKQDEIKNYALSKPLRISISIFLIFIVCVLAPGWLIRMSGDIAKHIPGETYGVFILDLCVVFPALLYITTGLIKKKAFAVTLAGIALFKVFTVCLSWSFAQWIVLFYGVKLDMGLTAISSLLTIISFCFIIHYLTNLHREEKIDV